MKYQLHIVNETEKADTVVAEYSTIKAMKELWYRDASYFLGQNKQMFNVWFPYFIKINARGFRGELSGAALKEKAL